MNQSKKLHPALAALIVIVLIGVVASVVIVVTQKKSDTDDAALNGSIAANTQSNTGSTDPSTNTATYKDGTYNATGSYITPGGKESIALTVVIKGGIITDSSLQQNADSRDSKEYQGVFARNYKSLVVGKAVDSVSLSRVAGSSLTSAGFNTALDTIKKDAKA